MSENFNRLPKNSPHVAVARRRCFAALSMTSTAGCDSERSQESRLFQQPVSCAALLLILSLLAPAHGQNGLPPPLRNVTIEQKLNSRIPLDVRFRDERGKEVLLKDYFGSRPVILAFVYYRCPMLCNLVLNGLTDSLRNVSFDAGKEFEIVTVSIDPSEKPPLAVAKKSGYIERYGREDAEAGWHFLTGEGRAIQRLANAAGFRYTYDEEHKQFVHASGIMVLTPGGKLARYFYGIEYSPRDLRLALVEAAKNHIGSPVDRFLLFCFHYDPTTGKYGLVITRIMQMGGVVTIVGLATFWLCMWRREGRASSI